MQISASIHYRNIYFIQYCRKYEWYCHINGVHTYVFKVSDYDKHYLEPLAYIVIPNMQISHRHCRKT